VSAIFIFGLLFYVYDPIIVYLNSAYPTSGPYATAMFFLWGALAGVNLFGSGIKLIMSIQRKD